MQKLELTWIGKGEQINPEPRILIEKPEYSYGDTASGNMLIHGDNLLALKALELEYAGKVKCVYIDPPYNTGSAFEHYDDNVEHSTWLNLMKPRLELLKNLLAEDGTIWIQVDDEEQAYLKVLCDEVFGRGNFINMISVNMKNIAGASGGGEDKRLKKNCEYILVYARDYSMLPLFNGPYTYTEMSELIQQYLDEGKSWKYTTVLLDSGEKEYIGSTVDGDGNEIRVYSRKNVITMSVNQLAKRDGISVKETFRKYGVNVFRTTNAQTSIRTRIIEYRKENNITDEILSIEYVPKTGKSKGVIYEQFYKSDVCNLFVWLKDTSEVIDGELYKKNLQGTYWDMNPWMKNLTKEGGVAFPNGKKPERLLQQILEMTTKEGDLVLDSFLGSGTTAAVAHKMGRKYIGIEFNGQATTHCVPRLKAVVDGEQGGISKAVNWQGGGGFKFYELAPTLLTTSKHGNLIISDKYNDEMLAQAMAKHEGYTYAPNADVFWKQGFSGENNFIFTTTGYISIAYLDNIASGLSEGEYLLICAESYDSACIKRHNNIIVRPIPKMLLGRCEWGKDSYDLNILLANSNDWEDINDNEE